MIKIICDICGKDCGLNAYVLSVNVIHNPNPTKYSDIGEIRLSDDYSHMRLCLCQECYHNTKLPNIYNIIRKDTGG